MTRVHSNTSSGRLCDKAKQSAVVEALPIFRESVSSMTTQLVPPIEQALKERCRYVMLSYRREENEALFEMVEDMPIYDLEITKVLFTHTRRRIH